MKKTNLTLNPIAVGFGGNILKERIIAIMNFKKPTALTTALSAFLVIGLGTTAFATAIKPIESNPIPEPKPVVTTSEPVVTASEPTVTASEPVSITNPADNNSETGEPEPIDLEDELESKYPRGEHSIPIFPEDKNGIYYSESEDVVRVPVHLFNVREQMFSGLSTNSVRNNKGTLYAHAIFDREVPRGYGYGIYFGDEFAVLTRNESIWKEQIAIYSQMEDDGIIPHQTTECFHDLDSLD